MIIAQGDEQNNNRTCTDLAINYLPEPRVSFVFVLEMTSQRSHRGIAVRTQRAMRGLDNFSVVNLQLVNRGDMFL